MPLIIDNTLKLSDDQFFTEETEKTGIALHHTVGRSAVSSFNWWMQDPRVVGTAYMIARDGKVHEIFKPECWAYQFGLRWEISKKVKFEKRFIGIELASEGALIENDGKLYCFDTISDKTLFPKPQAFDFQKKFRNYRYFDKYEDAQIDSLIELVNELCGKFNIEKQIPSGFTTCYDKQLKDFKGVIGHCMVRNDKTDPMPDEDFWNKIVNGCGLTKKNIGSKMTNEQITELFNHNVSIFLQMDRASGNMIKSLLWELQDEDRDTYIKLKNPAVNGHKVEYDFVHGNQNLVAVLAEGLGFKSWNNNTLEVFSG